MKIKTFFLILCAAALFFTGCEKDEFFSTQTDDNAVLKSAKVKEVSIEAIGSCYVTVKDLTEIPGLGDFPSIGVMRGNVTLLGEIQEDKSIWVTTSAVPDFVNGTLLWEQEGVWCAEDGDLLYWTISTTLVMGSGNVSGTAIFDGGTGRFKHASGYFDLQGHADPANPLGFIVDSGEGMIYFTGNQPHNTFVPFKGDFNIWIESFEEDGPDRTQVMVGTGKLTHLGKTDFYADENISMLTWTGAEKVTFTAANGDELFAYLINVIDPSGYPLLNIKGNGVFTGGTGKFENAEGTLMYYASFNVAENMGEKSFTGVINW